MTELLRCANCGIADEKVVHFPPPQGPVGYDSHSGPCLQAALALLRECRPLAEYWKGSDCVVGQTARAILAKLPGEA